MSVNPRTITIKIDRDDAHLVVQALKYYLFPEDIAKLHKFYNYATLTATDLHNKLEAVHDQIVRDICADLSQECEEIKCERVKHEEM